MIHSRVLSSAMLGVVAMSATASSAGVIINLDFSGGGLTTSQQAVFASAKATWQSVLTGYQPGVSITGLTISATGQAIDGVGGVLGSAGPSAYVTQAGHSLPTTGQMQFDSADLSNMESNGTLGAVILHEMGHVLGFGTMWTLNNVYTSGTGHYTGAFALAAYKTEFNQPSATFVPVELGGGSGTADGHWNENDGGGINTGIVDSQGHDMRNELMTGWLDAPVFMSNTTIQSMRDLGYATVPEPSTMAGLGFAGLLLTQRRRKTALPGR